MARGKVDRPRKDLRAGRRIEQIAFKIDDLRGFDIRLADIAGSNSMQAPR